MEHMTMTFRVSMKLHDVLSNLEVFQSDSAAWTCVGIFLCELSAPILHHHLNCECRVKSEELLLVVGSIHECKSKISHVHLKSFVILNIIGIIPLNY
ncbi:unnamed protein product [Moneuplotes crassus]|uniref:Uncharacterized protein n=1 Tax=Euplotes crassus TaxID=5936 RepID=A0AAD1TZE6_EUPCR|nr:unnamed protein product [Moneuplotes crassus]